MPDLNTDDKAMHTLLTQARTIAVVGHSDRPDRTSYQIAMYLRRVGYRVYAVNPQISEVNGEVAYASLADLPESVDIVNVFRRSEHLDGVVEEAIASGARGLWTQLNVVDEAAIAKALQAGLHIAHDRCIKVEHIRLNIAARPLE